MNQNSNRVKRTGTQVASAVNIKGGVGKTTTIGCLAELLAELGKQVLLVDMDPQGNLSQLFRRYQTSKNTINELLMLQGAEVTKENVSACIQHTSNARIDIISSNEELTFTSDMIAYDQKRAQQQILKRALNTVKAEYDFILIDNTPFYNILTINSLTASDYVITPVGTNGFSYAGLIKLLGAINRTKEEFNEGLIFKGAFITNAKNKRVVFKDLFENYRDELKDKFLEEYIREDKNVEESNTEFVPLISYNSNTNAAEDYRKLLYALNILDELASLKLLKNIKEAELRDLVKEMGDYQKALEKPTTKEKSRLTLTTKIAEAKEKIKTLQEEMESLEYQIKIEENTDRQIKSKE